MRQTISTEHLLLGRSRSGIAGKFCDLGLEPNAFRKLLSEQVSASLTAENRLVRRAGSEFAKKARRMGHHYIGTEHLCCAGALNGGKAMDVP
jgi:ATP-dependent Clp protease ATP-binding subunit ClpC